MAARQVFGPAEGVVKWWDSEEGYGVVLTCDAAPKAIWVHYSHLDGPGYRGFVAEERVEIEYEAAQQDGYVFRALRVRRSANAAG